MAGARPDTWMPMYWGDYLKDTGHLSTLEHGAYVLLIGHYWSTGTPLPDDDSKLKRITKVESAAQWRKLRPALVQFFKVAGGLWRHKRVDEELGEALKRSTKAKKAAKARWEGEHDDIPEAPIGDDAPEMLRASSEHAPSIDLASPEHMPDECLLQPQSQSPSPSTRDEPKISAAAASVAARDTAPPDGIASQHALIERAFADWLPVACDLGIADPGFLNSERRAKMAARFAEAGWQFDVWTAFLANLREAEFLREDGRAKRWVNLGKLLEPEHFTAVLEGRYREQRQRQTDAPAIYRGAVSLEGKMPLKSILEDQ